MKKILCLVLSIALMMSTAVFAATNETIETITALEIMVGDETGDLKLNEYITRAEFTAIVLRMMGLTDAGSSAAEIFDDVPATHWASGAINLAAQLKIVNGYGNGKFGPEDTIKYEEAIKMIVATLGYTPMAVANGGYPGGFQVVAAQRGILAGVKGYSNRDPITRGDIATIVVNALTVPLMEQTGYGSDITIETVSTHLLEKLGITKYEGKVVGTKASGATSEGKVKVHYDYAIEAFAGKATAQKVEVNNDKIVIAAGDIEAKAKEFLDMPAVLYVKDADTKNAELICIVKNDIGTSVSFMSEDIKSYDAVNGILEVYTDKETGEYEEYELNISKKYYNGREKNTINNLGKSFDVTLLATDEDKYDIIYITEYVDVRVENISARNWKIYTNKGSYVLDETDKDCSFVIYKDGKEVSFDTIKKDDILSIAGGKDGDVLKYGKVYITTETVEGMVSGKYSNSGDIKVSGKVYKTTNNISDNVKVGDSYIFYLNARGVIIDFDKTINSSNLKYGFASWIYKDADFGDSKIRLLTSNNTWITYDFADKVRLNNVKTNVEDIANGLTNITDTSKYVLNKVIAYELDDEGCINMIYTNNSDEFDSGMFVSNSSAEYIAATGMLGGYDVDNTTVIFSINNGYSIPNDAAIDEDKITVVSANSLTDRYSYNIIEGYNEDKDTDIWSVLVGKDIAPGIDWTSDFFVICEEPVYTVNDKDEEGISLTGLQNGEKVTIFINEDNSNITKATWVNEIGDFTKGDVVIYNLDNSGEVAEIKILLDIDEVVTEGALVNKTITETITVGTTTYEFIYGRATDRKNTNITINDNIYKFNANLIGANYDHFTLNKVSEAGYGDIVYDDIDKNDGDYVFARISNNVIVEDFVIISNNR